MSESFQIWRTERSPSSESCRSSSGPATVAKGDGKEDDKEKEAVPMADPGLSCSMLASSLGLLLLLVISTWASNRSRQQQLTRLVDNCTGFAPAPVHPLPDLYHLHLLTWHMPALLTQSRFLSQSEKKQAAFYFWVRWVATFEGMTPGRQKTQECQCE